MIRRVKQQIEEAKNYTQMDADGKAIYDLMEIVAENQRIRNFAVLA